MTAEARKDLDMSSTLEPGLTGEATTLVTDQNMAITLGSGDVPVFATPALLALMEAAAVNAVAGRLPAEQTTVGVEANVRHLAATPLGMTVRAAARLLAVEGRRLLFRVDAYDDVEPIGEGTHVRMIVERERFVQRTLAKRK